MVESADIRPAPSAVKVAVETCKKLQSELDAWRKLNAEDVPALNKQVQAGQLAALPVASTKPDPLVCTP
jgi:hypothetical protein